MSMTSIFLKLGPFEIGATGIIGTIAAVIVVALIIYSLQFNKRRMG